MKKPHYLTTEVALLKLHYPEGGVAAVQKAGVKRSKQSIQRQAMRLGIKSTFHWRRDWND